LDIDLSWAKLNRGECRKLADDVAHKGFCVAKQHQSLVHVVERIINSSKAWAHATLDHMNSLSLVHVDDGMP